MITKQELKAERTPDLISICDRLEAKLSTLYSITSGIGTACDKINPLRNDESISKKENTLVSESIVNRLNESIEKLVDLNGKLENYRDHLNTLV